MVMFVKNSSEKNESTTDDELIVSQVDISHRENWKSISLSLSCDAKIRSDIKNRREWKTHRTYLAVTITNSSSSSTERTMLVFFLVFMSVLCSMPIKHNDSCRWTASYFLLLPILFFSKPCHWLLCNGTFLKLSFFLSYSLCCSITLPLVFSLSFSPSRTVGWSYFHHFHSAVRTWYIALQCNAWLILLAFLNKWRTNQPNAQKLQNTFIFFIWFLFLYVYDVISFHGNEIPVFIFRKIRIWKKNKIAA